MSRLIVRNFVAGCAMLTKTKAAKAAIPFEDDMVHDHWLALVAALNGKIAFEPKKQSGTDSTAIIRPPFW